jgi:cation diffusion facilitator family transporter
VATHHSHAGHAHIFGLDAQQTGERSTFWVMILTFVTMVVELIAGSITGSMALTADGWHMSTHVAALGIAAFAYRFARNHATNPRFTFGTGKVTSLGGFASAVALAMVAVLMTVESVERLLSPVPVAFGDAMAVACVGLIVNLASAWILSRSGHHHHHGLFGHDDHDDHDHDHDHHDHDHDHDHHDHDHDHHDHDHHEGHKTKAEHQDFNLKAAYLHVLADALTSVTAIVALATGYFFGWIWMDPCMGIAGSIVILMWSRGLLRESGAVLLDAEENDHRRNEIMHCLQRDTDKVADLHLWRVGPASHACIVSVITPSGRSADDYKTQLQTIAGLDHITVEVNHCETCVNGLCHP